MPPLPIAEWRFPFLPNNDRVGGVMFLNATTASSRTENVPLFDNVRLGSGLGLRYMPSPKNRVNVSVDYGWGFSTVPPDPS